MATTIVRMLSKFPSWVPKTSTATNILLVMASFATAATLGFDESMMNALNILPSYTDYFHLNPTTIALNSAVIWLGAIFGCIINIVFKIPDVIGRKPSMFWCCIVEVVGIFLQASAQNIGMFLVARFIVGIGVGGTYVICPAFLAETLPLKHRAWGLGAFNDLYYVGGLISSGVTYATAKMDSTWAWRLPSAIQGIFSIVTILILPFIPESPRFLAYSGQKDASLLSIAQTLSDGNIADPMVQLQYVQIAETMEYEKNNEVAPVKQIIVDPGKRKRILLALSSSVFNTLTGSNIFSYYLGTSLSHAGITDSTTQLQINIILNAFCLVVCIVGTYFVDRMGRVNLALSSTAACTAFLFIIGALTKYYGNSTNTSAIYANVGMIFLAQGSFSFGWTPLTALYPPEVLNYSIRSLGMSLHIIFAFCLIMLPLFAFPIGMSTIGWKFYIINGAWDAFEFVLIYLYWVETKGKTLEEIDAEFDGTVHSQVQGMASITKGGEDAFMNAKQLLAEIEVGVTEVHAPVEEEKN